MESSSYISPQKSKHGPFLRFFYRTIGAFSVTERVLFYAFVMVAAIAGLTLLSNLNNRFLVAVPDFGGTINEGIVGIPRFVNPVLAVSDADKDLTALVFAGLLKTNTDGSLSPDLAKSYEISPDGRTYTFTLRDDIFFHDNTRVTTDDVEFTIQRIQDPTIKSPKRPVWDGISMQKLDSRRITFSLKEPYSPFIDNFTVGIIPKHVWKDVPSDEFSFSELNVNAVGEGPYDVKAVDRNSYGLPSDYILRAYSNYSLGQPYVKQITMNFFQTEDDLLNAFSKGDIDAMSGISPINVKKYGIPEDRVVTTTLPRIFGVFFNQNQAGVFLNAEVRQALSVAINKDRIINDILLGYGSAIESPVPELEATDTNPTAAATATDASTATVPTSPISRIDQAISILTKAGWTLNEKTGIMEKKVSGKAVPLAFSLSTGDAPELKQAAEYVKEDWEKIGASVDLKVFEIGDLNQNVIRTRKFDALLFGEVIGREYDLYPFWHSSQRNDPGLNIALYTNAAADKILELLRVTQDRDTRAKKAADFEAIFKKDLPAALIYSPKFIYVIPKNLQNVSFGNLTQPSERFLNVQKWYIETNKVWKVFAH